MPSSVEIFLSDESREDIAEALSKLQSFMGGRLEVYDLEMTIQGASVKYTCYRYERAMHLILYGVAPCSMSHTVISAKTGRSQDACLAMLYALALDTVHLDESGTSIEGNLKSQILRNRKRQCSCGCHDVALNILRDSFDISDT
ncbi:hypothetical protein P389DRAFT_36799 [Cystobasidium minutum MCA 4210]|uniref:uncharacterized protein n=1 Tax=Cystobasidium minutum MCA 4210 TaxID=1397322 RepID=UPI0034CE5CF0|eukprot:jgi/Rhomi1/36799/CE36798_512